MAKDAGKLLELLNDTQLSELYQSRIRHLQPADVVRRLESEGISTCGSMLALRARLLRFEARKSQVRSPVPWYPEDKILRKKTSTSEENTISDHVSKAAKSTDEKKANVTLITPDQFMKTMVQLGFWNPDGEPIKPSVRKSKKPRVRQQWVPFLRPCCRPSLNDVEIQFKELSLTNREVRQRRKEVYEANQRLMATELIRMHMIGTRNSEASQQTEEASNYHSPVTRRIAARLLQQQEAGPSTSYDKEVTNQPKTSPEPLRRFKTNEEYGDDPFENVGSDDWMDDFIE